MSTETAIVTTPKQPVSIGNQGLQLTDMDSMFRFATAVAKSGLAPKGIDTPEAIFVALQMGMELGLPYMAALQNIAVINGRPGIYGDSALGLVRKSGLLEDYSEVFEGTPGADTFACIVTSKRRDMSKPMVSKFSIADAKKAQLWGKQGPWAQYPERMLKWRARGFNLRDNFGDVLKGFRTTEELGDMHDEEARFEKAKPVTGTPSFGGTPAKTETVSTEATTTQVVEVTPQQQLAEIVINGGYDFDAFKAWGKEMGHINDEGSFDEIKADVAKRLIRAKTGLLSGLALVKGATK